MSARAVDWNPSSAGRTVTQTPSATAAAYAARSRRLAEP